MIMGQQHVPTALVLSRQSLPTLDRSKYASAEGVARGGYVLADCEGEPQVILIATGSEVALAVAALRPSHIRLDFLGTKKAPADAGA